MDSLDCFECRHLDAGHCRHLADDVADYVPSADCFNADGGQFARAGPGMAGRSDCGAVRAAETEERRAELDAGGGGGVGGGGQVSLVV